jgi:hypothetical protein
MTSHDLFVLALRIMGFWAFIAMVAGIGSVGTASFGLVQALASGGNPTANFDIWYFVIAGVLPPILQGLAGLVLILGAPRIASFFYSRNRDGQELATSANVAFCNLCEIAIRLIGIYAVLLAVKPIAGFALYLAEPHEHLRFSARGEAVAASLYVILGGVLFFGARRLARSLSWSN